MAVVPGPLAGPGLGRAVLTGTDRLDQPDPAPDRSRGRSRAAAADSDDAAGPARGDADLGELLRPFSARSLVASALIGSHPPALPGRLLVALGQRFGISGGTTRVALSRMVERGELTNDDGTYALAGDLLARQERQDRSRDAPAPTWDGTWEQAVVTSTGRSAADRARLRATLTELGLGELREGVWMRPANLDPDRLPSSRARIADQVAWYRVAPLSGDDTAATAGGDDTADAAGGDDTADAAGGDDTADDAAGRALAAALYDLDGWSATATDLARAIERAKGRLETDDDAVVSGFRLASATLRHLIHDPQLPPALLPDGWPADGLRLAYEDYERAYQRLLRAFFRASR